MQPDPAPVWNPSDQTDRAAFIGCTLQVGCFDFLCRILRIHRLTLIQVDRFRTEGHHDRGFQNITVTAPEFLVQLCDHTPPVYAGKNTAIMVDFHGGTVDGRIISAVSVENQNLAESVSRNLVAKLF